MQLIFGTGTELSRKFAELRENVTEDRPVSCDGVTPELLKFLTNAILRKIRLTEDGASRIISEINDRIGTEACHFPSALK